MKGKSKKKIFINCGLLIVLIGVLYYVMDNSLNEIFKQLLDTSWVVLALIILFGVVYQIIEGRSIQAIASCFEKEFTTTDGFFTSCYVAFYRIVTFGTGTLVSEIYFYRKKGLAVSQGIGVTALHMIMYKMAVIFWALFGLVIQFSLFYEYAPKMIPFILVGMVLTCVIIVTLLLLSSSINLQVMLTVWANKHIRKEKLRDWVDKCNIQIYSLRETVQTITKDRSTAIRIFAWNVGKLVFWYLIPYVVLWEKHPTLDLLLVFSFTSFAVILSGVFPTPAGIGPFEFVYLLLFKPLVGTVDAVSSLLLYRFASFVLPFLIGFVYVVIQKRYEIKSDLENIKKEKQQIAEE